ncbi:hypothetical protein HMPREF0201_00169 [Cedecea davisae DSM 4568]|uniref:Uncharacterized protein n=1 Tax=Cedecea davisae DSM 4568 TaxID=566551 RepID=S3J3M3_9ENTR|nr:hypothetical protein HMPREF0201_00169 [Cedecea davisae DSM 4568]
MNVINWGVIFLPNSGHFFFAPWRGVQFHQMVTFAQLTDFFILRSFFQGRCSPA